MNVHIGRTWSHHRPHRTLIIVTRRWYAHVWVHAFARGWWFRDTGMLCCGCGWISCNLFALARGSS